MIVKISIFIKCYLALKFQTKTSNIASTTEPSQTVAFINLQIEDGVHLLCKDNEMIFTLKINVSVKNDDVITFQNNASCPIGQNSTHVIARTTFLQCGTQFEETENEFLFKNVLRITPRVSDDWFILRNDKIPVEYELECSFSKLLRTTVDTGVIHIGGNIYFFKYN